MKVKIQSHPKKTIEVENVFFSSDLHLNHEAVIKFGRKFSDVIEMNDSIILEVNTIVGENDLLVLLGDTMMIDKNYFQFLSSIKCKNVVMLYGNHCNPNRFEEGSPANLLYHGYYAEFNIDKQVICCSHYPMFNWNYQDDGSFHLHGHLHSDENPVIAEIHKHRSMDVGVDCYHKLFGKYSIFSLPEIKDILKDKLVIGRHETPNQTTTQRS